MMNEYHGIKKRIDMDLLSRSHVAIVIYCVIFPAILHPFDLYATSPLICWGITGSVIFICILRIIHRVTTGIFYDRFPVFWIILFTAFSLIHGGILGGLFALVIIDEQFSVAFPVTLIVVAGMSSGAITSLSPNLVLALLYPQVLLIPGIVSTFYLEPNTANGWIMVMYLVYLSVLAVLTNKEYMRTFSIEEQLERQKKELETLSRTDALTGIFNRGYFNTIYEMQWDSGVRNNTGITLMMLDVDHFKSVNDKYGHPSGDECLICVAKVLMDSLKRKTDIACRFGGEEFAVLLGRTPVHEAEVIAETIRAKIEKMWIIYGEFKFQVTISVGIASTLPKIGVQPESLLEQADQALYSAKKGGRNCIRTYG